LQFPMARHAVVVAPASNAPELLVPAIRAALARFDPQLVATYMPATQAVDATLERHELGMSLMLVFGATALALAAIGLYGVIAYAAAQRGTELATRVALGASGRQVFWLVMGGGQRLLLVGLVLGLALAYAAGQVVSGSVFAMRAADPLVLMTAALTVSAVTWLATMIPAIRASRQDPVRGLRAE
jgi:putative ABC transport system permease protein